MTIIGIILIVLFAIVAVLISFFVLIQDDQGEGLGGLFGGGGGSSTPFGASSNNVLTKVTAFLGILFMIFSFFVAYLLRTPDEDNVEAEARRLQAESQDSEWFYTYNENLGLNTEAGDMLVLPEE
jgi:preprotein translocase subunit SecG